MGGWVDGWMDGWNWLQNFHAAAGHVHCSVFLYRIRVLGDVAGEPHTR